MLITAPTTKREKCGRRAWRASGSRPVLTRDEVGHGVCGHRQSAPPQAAPAAVACKSEAGRMGWGPHAVKSPHHPVSLVRIRTSCPRLGSGQSGRQSSSLPAAVCGLGGCTSGVQGPLSQPSVLPHPRLLLGHLLPSPPNIETLWFEPSCPTQTSHLSDFLSHQSLAGGALWFLC